jgi:predicted dehydrogenase
MIRCDTHAAWFGVMMARHDPLKFRTPVPFRENLKYTWMAGGVHYFHYSHYSDPTRMTCPFVGGFEIVRVWDEDREAADAFANLFTKPAKVCDSFADVSDDVDLVFIADCNGDGSDHHELAEPGLRKGVATFLDKPQADSREAAERIVQLAASCGAPIFSASILQFDQEVLWFRDRLPETGGVHSGIISGFSTHPASLVHSVSAAHTIFGGGVRRVSCLNVPGGPIVHLDYAGSPGRPKSGVIIRCGEADYRWTTMKASAYGPNGDIHGQILHDFNCQHGSSEIIRKIAQMVETRKVPHEQNDTAEIIAIMDAIRRAEISGHAIEV